MTAASLSAWAELCRRATTLPCRNCGRELRHDGGCEWELEAFAACSPERVLALIAVALAAQAMVDAESKDDETIDSTYDEFRNALSALEESLKL